MRVFDLIVSVKESVDPSKASLQCSTAVSPIAIFKAGGNFAHQVSWSKPSTTCLDFGRVFFDEKHSWI